MSPLLSKLIPLLAYAAIAALLAHLAWRLWLQRRSGTWPSVTGRVLEARIVRGFSYEDDEDSTLSRRQGSEYFEIEVKYEYRVRGKGYVGTKHSFGSGQYLDYDAAMQALRGIAAGSEVPVYYDPARPERAVLRKGMKSAVEPVPRHP